MATEAEKRDNSREWLIIAGCFLLVFSGGSFYSLTVFFTSFETDFGWSRTLISSVQSTYLLVSAGSNVMSGWLISKIGLRPTLVICAVLLGAGLALCGQISSIGQFLGFYGLASVGVGANYVVPVVAVQGLVSEKRIGLALGLTTAGLAASRLVFIPLSGFLISAVGWRTSYLLMGIATFAMVVIGMLMIPSKGREAADGRTGSGPATKKQASTKVSAKAVLTSPALLLTGLLFVVPVTANQMIVVHIVPFAEGENISKASAAAAAGFIGAFGVAGNVVWPTLSSRVPWRWLAFLACAGAGLSLLWLVVTSQLWMLYIFAAMYGFTFYGLGPTRVGFARSIFGAASMPSLVGIFMGTGAAMAALGPIVTGYVYDNTGSYSVAFMIGAAGWLLAGLAALMLRKPGTVTGEQRSKSKD